MTALMVALVAGMVVGSDAVERISTETAERLAIDGCWEGTWNGPVPSRHVSGYGLCNVRIKPGEISLKGDKFLVWLGIDRWIDEGKGKCRIGNGWQGIYKRQGGRLIICFVNVDSDLPAILQDPRPTIFQANERQVLLIIKPTKPPKK